MAQSAATIARLQSSANAPFPGNVTFRNEKLSSSEKIKNSGGFSESFVVAERSVVPKKIRF